MTRLVYVLFIVAGLCMSSGPAMAEDYRLGPEDRLSIRAVIWNDSQRGFELWDLLSGEYIVQANGTVAVPIAGATPASGLTTSELSDRLAEVIKTNGGMIEPPRISVQIVTYRPFFVLGSVQQPGAYAARPGLTALQALALAGGTRQPIGEAISSAAGVRNVGRLRDLRNKLARASAREARLEAEVARAMSISFDDTTPHPEGPAATDRIRAQERAIFAARKAALERELAALEDLNDLLNVELRGLRDKLEGQETQLRLAQENIARISTLTERGLVPATRLPEAQRQLINLEAQQTDLQNNVYRARQSLSENARVVVELNARQATQATLELQQVKAQLEQLEIDAEVMERVIIAEGLDASVAGLNEVRTDFYVTRAGSGDGGRRPISEHDPIGPGDVLIVETMLSEPVLGTQ